MTAKSRHSRRSGARNNPRYRAGAAPLSPELVRRLESALSGLERGDRIEKIINRQLAAFEKQMQAAMQNWLQQGLAQMFGVGGDTAASLIGSLVPLPKFSQGGVIDGARLLALGGEAGPEAVLPLHRGADGALGVRVTGGQSAPAHIAPMHGAPMHVEVKMDAAVHDGQDSVPPVMQTAIEAALSSAWEEALDQAFTSRLRAQMRDGGMLDAHDRDGAGGFGSFAS